MRRNCTANGMTEDQLAALRWLHERGGSGVLDPHGRVLAGGESKTQGSWPCWLRLMIHGYLAGQDGRIVITDKGRTLL